MKDVQKLLQQEDKDLTEKKKKDLLRSLNLKELSYNPTDELKNLLEGKTNSSKN